MFVGMLLLIQAVQTAPVREVRDTAAIMPAPPSLSPPDTNKRPVAVEYSDAYYERLLVHRIFSYAELPVFATEYYLGERLLSTNVQPSWVKPTHTGVALTLGGLFAVNTVTGLWNLWDSRNDPDQRGLIVAHSLLMLASDAGFMMTGATAGSAKRSFTDAHTHRAWAVGSMGVATVGTVMMWLFRK